MFYISVYMFIGLLLCVLVGLLARSKKFYDPILLNPMALFLMLFFWPLAICAFLYGACSGFITRRRHIKKRQQKPLVTYDPLLEVMQKALEKGKE